MNLRILSIISVFALLSGSTGCQQSPPRNAKASLTLFNFEQGITAERVETIEAEYDLFEIDQQTALRVTTGGNHSKPGVVLKESPEQPWDLQGFYQVKADVTNTGDEFIQVEMFVGNDPDGLTRWYCSDYADLQPNESKTITVNLSWTPWVHEPQLEMVGMRGIPGKIKTDIEAINDITFVSRYATQENQFLVHNVRAVGQMEVRDTAGFFPFINEFGQYRHREWKGKNPFDGRIKTI